VEILKGICLNVSLSSEGRQLTVRNQLDNVYLVEWCLEANVLVSVLLTSINLSLCSDFTEETDRQTDRPRQCVQ